MKKTKKNQFRYAFAVNQPLANNPKHQFAQNHALMLYRANALYSFIPKNACSTLRFSLALENGCIRDEKDINWIHANNGTFRASLREAITADYTFVVLRCPFRRLASVFLDKFVSKDVPSWQYIDAMGREIALDDLTFYHFVNSLARPQIRNANIHWRPQVDFLLYEHYHDVFCVERFAQAISKLEELLQFSVRDARPLTRHGLDQFSLLNHGSFANVPIKELMVMKAEEKLPGIASLYDKAAYQAVATSYREDVALYRETCPDGELLALSDVVSGNG
ncbi:sulfotransferase family 2 domain-containing protein [Billgrantia diversa]|uniref:sulfotransferase family 2 domain-containing protein n=1 Tax=Halomonas sp. MCCC 1A13316 TaxID=2733487 RepID=UPI0018A4E9DC|nr:sulfotransferase family 2 domain-containing protein [Halomonas sp. MCCC 1A13316]QOR37434.1 sulfotransferase family 2 domain-containing protein [Halomonas sp. MCCC 1A13316]